MRRVVAFPAFALRNEFNDISKLVIRSAIRTEYRVAFPHLYNNRPRKARAVLSALTISVPCALVHCVEAFASGGYLACASE